MLLSNSAGDDFIKSSNSNFTPLSLSIVLHSDFSNASSASKVAMSWLRDSKLKIDRSLSAAKIKSHTGLVVPDWDTMLSELYLWGQRNALHKY